MPDNSKVCQVVRQPVRSEGGGDFKVPGDAVRRMALVGGRFAGEGRRWGRGGGCRSIGVIGHRAVWLVSGGIRVFLDWAAQIEFPVCVPVGRDGFWWDRRPPRRLDRWRSCGELQAFERLRFRPRWPPVTPPEHRLPQKTPARRGRVSNRALGRAAAPGRGSGVSPRGPSRVRS
jgi:hypothetical protein